MLRARKRTRTPLVRPLWLALLSLLRIGPPAYAAPLDGLWEGVPHTEIGGTSIHLDRTQRVHDRVSTTLRRADGQRAAKLILRHPSHPGHPVGDFSVTLHLPRGDLMDPSEREAVRALQHLLEHLAEVDGADLAAQLPSLPDDARGFVARLGVHQRAARVPAILGALWMLALVVSRGRGLSWSWGLKPNHIVPSLLQVSIFTYWSQYFPGVASRVPDLLSQLLFAFALDALLQWTRYGHWRIGVGPLPIVLSTNLFVWYGAPPLQWLVIGVAITSRLLFQRHGRHLFNPSAFGITIAALLTLLLPRSFAWGSPTMGEELNLAPNMTEFLMLAALLAQSRFPIVLVPIAAVTTFPFLGPFDVGPAPFRPATFLILVLFATDPSTIPRTNPGRFLYGVFLAVAISMVSQILTDHGLPDAYAKVLPIPVANLLAPSFDRLAGLLSRGVPYLRARPPLASLALGTTFFVNPLLALLALAGTLPSNRPPSRDAPRDAEPSTRLLHPRYNRWHLATWVVLTYLGLGSSKADSFPVFKHFNHDTPGLALNDGFFARCEDNPAFCKPFSFAHEIRDRPPSGAPPL